MSVYSWIDRRLQININKSASFYMPDRVSSVAAYSAASVGVVSGLTFNEWMTLIAVLIALGNFLLNWHYKRVDRARRIQKEIDAANCETCSAPSAPPELGSSPK